MATDDRSITPSEDSSPLTPAQATELEFQERVITDGLATFIAVGTALTAIREGRLYRATHPTFEAYCKERWNMGASRARQLIGASAVAKELESVTPGNTPTSEKQARPLAPLPPPQRKEAWERATKASKGKPPTAKQVQAAVETVAPKPPTKDVNTVLTEDTVQPETFAITLRPENHARVIAHCKRLNVQPQAWITRLILDSLPKAPSPNGKPTTAK